MTLDPLLSNSPFIGMYSSDIAAAAFLAIEGMAAADGPVYLNTTLNELRARNAGTWVTIGAAITQAITDLGAASGSVTLDGKSLFRISSSAYAGTMTLPAAADNLGQIITLANRGSKQFDITMSGGDTLEDAANPRIKHRETFEMQAVAAGKWELK